MRVLSAGLSVASILFFAPGLALAQNVGIGPLLSIGSSEESTMYRWISSASPATGDTLRIRHAVMNTGDAVLQLDPELCDLEVTGTLALEPLARHCVADGQLEPGDSAWIERTWIVTSPPGRYQLGIEVGDPGSDTTRTTFSTAVDVVARRSDEGRGSSTRRADAPRRVPVLIVFTSSDATPFVTEADLRSLVRLARVGGPSILPVVVTPAAAEGMARLAPYLMISLDVTQDGRYALSSCWYGPGKEALGGCSSRTGGNTSPVIFGADMGRFLARELRRDPNSRRKTGDRP